MPNWCSNNLGFFTRSDDLTELKKLYKNIKKATEDKGVVKNDFGASWLGNIAEFHGLY